MPAKPLPISWRSILVFSADVAASGLAWIGAYWLRFSFDFPAEFRPAMWLGLAVAVPIQAIAFRAFGLYRGIWVFASLPDLMRIGRAVGFSVLLVPALVWLVVQTEPWVPRSVFAIQPILVLVLMGGSRAIYRAWREYRLYGDLIARGRPVIVLGAGATASSLVRELSRSSDWRVVGLLDDDPAKQGRDLQGHRVLGPISSLARWADELKVQHAIVAMPSAPHDVRRRVASQCVRAGLRAMTVPSFDDLIGGHVTVSKVRRVEVEDLLGRDAVRIDASQVTSFIRGRTVMVTGAGGSIGAELCRQVARFRPALLVAFEQSEFALYSLQENLREHFPELHLVGLAGDVKDRLAVERALRRYAPAVVLHAAAYKHVPMMEEYNAWEAVRNNVYGTYQVARACGELGVEKFVLVSTDKAVNPTNVMGASKRLAEMVCQALQATSSATRFEMVRFGNVLGSTGSVIPKFQEQIARGGPVTVTHPEITRYFMSIPEASQLVLQAAAMGQGGEIFVLDMGDPVKIVDLARDMIRLSGFSENDIRVVFTGLRPGEKLYEEVLADDEHTRHTPHPKLRIAQAREVEPGWLDDLLKWLRQGRILEDAEVRRDLRRWVPEYAPAAKPELFAVIDGPPDRSRGA
jgi:FlaA1/EpsC-like NDP-sugar epimerase